MIKYRTMNKTKADRIRELYFNKYFAYKQGELATMFFMSQSSINRIINNEVW